MKFTRDQYNEIDKLYIDDFPINDGDQDLMFNLFNNLDEYLQGMSIQWGFSDTGVRLGIFEELCNKLLGMTIREYYKSEIYKEYINSGKYIDIDLMKLGK